MPHSSACIGSSELVSVSMATKPTSRARDPGVEPVEAAHGLVFRLRSNFCARASARAAASACGVSDAVFGLARSSRGAR
jgi:hypothetical protein